MFFKEVINCNDSHIEKHITTFKKRIINKISLRNFSNNDK